MAATASSSSLGTSGRGDKRATATETSEICFGSVLRCLTNLFSGRFSRTNNLPWTSLYHLINTSFCHFIRSLSSTEIDILDIDNDEVGAVLGDLLQTGNIDSFRAGSFT
mmetsp:Transcript_86295/g.167230  ORF Transcript_86295/g.167230 Transcript_86295/m.167230 type:complete len:109 (+) Transcript_86295:1008-1334(+)